MIVRVFDINKYVFERANVFAKQLECPDLVKPQIIARRKHTYNTANDEGTDRHPQHEYIKRRALRHNFCFQTNCFALSLCDCGCALVGLAQSDHIVNEIAQLRFCLGCGERFVADEYRFHYLLS